METVDNVVFSQVRAGFGEVDEMWAKSWLERPGGDDADRPSKSAGVMGCDPQGCPQAVHARFDLPRCHVGTTEEAGRRPLTNGSAS